MGVPLCSPLGTRATRSAIRSLCSPLSSFGGYARVQSIAIKNKTTTLATEYARQGKNWKTELAQFEKERQFLQEHGISGD